MIYTLASYIYVAVAFSLNIFCVVIEHSHDDMEQLLCEAEICNISGRKCSGLDVTSMALVA